MPRNYSWFKMVVLQKMFRKISRQSQTRRKYLNDTKMCMDMYTDSIRKFYCSVLDITD